MDRYKETFETWNKVALLYQEKFMDLSLYNDSYDFICDTLLKPGSSILEIGCGPGNITKYLLSKRPDFNIMGIDIAPNMVELARINNPAASFAVMDSRDIANIKTRYDGIVCGFCLPYLSHTDGYKLIRDCYNLLNENGLLYISFVEGDPGNSGFQTGSGGNRAYFYFYTLEALIQHVEQINFKKIKPFKVAYPKSDNKFDTHTILTAQKTS